MMLIQQLIYYEIRKRDLGQKGDGYARKGDGWGGGVERVGRRIDIHGILIELTSFPTNHCFSPRNFEY